MKFLRPSIQMHPSATSYSLKYADKLQQKAQEKGLGIEELGSQAREEARRKHWRASLLDTKARSNAPEGARTSSVRKDSSPVKATVQMQRDSYPHIHGSRNKGTGGCYVCASLPLQSYSAMTHVIYTDLSRSHGIVLLRGEERPPLSAIGDGTWGNGSKSRSNQNIGGETGIEFAGSGAHDARNHTPLRWTMHFSFPQKETALIVTPT
ncbi:hypothetical protein EV363DRAFT_1392809 [Boletus edulis]|nr:hypothetical protein EV363DRAFT_1392809 [Boletus edulis]